MGEHLLCKQGVVGSIPISSTTTGNRGHRNRQDKRRGLARLSIAPHDNVQLCASATECNAESCRSLTIREGKAHSGLMRVRMRRVELYLAWACETKGARPGGANTLVNVLSLGAGERCVDGFICPLLPGLCHLKGPRLWGQATKCM